MNSFLVHIIIINALDLVGVLVAKYYSINRNPWLLFLTAALFAGAGFFFARSLRFEGMAIANILWITISIILVTIMGHFLFKEQISSFQIFGIGLILLGLVFINWK